MRTKLMCTFFRNLVVCQCACAFFAYIHVCVIFRQVQTLESSNTNNRRLLRRVSSASIYNIYFAVNMAKGVKPTNTKTFFRVFNILLEWEFSL